MLLPAGSSREASSRTGGASSRPASSTGGRVPVPHAPPGIELRYAHKPRTKGKIEDQIRLLQRDFVLEHLHHSRLDALNAAWITWVERHNWQYQHKGLTANCPPDCYVRCLRQPSAEEPRKVMRTGHISCYGQFYRVPDRYVGRRVWVVLKGETLRIE